MIIVVSCCPAILQAHVPKHFHDFTDTEISSALHISATLCSQVAFFLFCFVFCGSQFECTLLPQSIRLAHSVCQNFNL